MEKRKLSAIERPKATPEMVEKARELIDIKYIAEPKLIDKTILVINFFSISDLKEGSTTAKFRTFLSKDDYITQDLTKDNTKWLTASLNLIEELGLYHYKWDECERRYKINCLTYIGAKQSVVEIFFGEYRKHEQETVWDLITRFQNKVKERRLEQKHRKVLDPIDFMEFPKFEWICKMGLNNLAANIVNKYSFYYISTDVIDYKANTIYEILGLTKVNTKILQEIDGNTDELDLLREAQRLDIRMSAEQVKEYYEVFGCDIKLLREKGNRISFHKFFKYFDKEIERYMNGKSKDKSRREELIELKRNMVNDWKDYLSWCRELKYNLDNMFIYMPNNFKQVHDRVAKEYKDLKDRKAAAEKKRRDKLVAKKMQKIKKDMEEIFSKNVGVDALNIKGNGLILIVPANSEAIKEEGEALHHCVGTYIERVAKGETAIFFIRRESEPDKPYYTLEWRDNKVIQCRGMNNCSVTDKVKAFVQAFEEKMNEQIKAKESA